MAAMAAPPQKFHNRLVAELAALSMRLEEAYEREVAGLRWEMEQCRGAEIAAKQAEMEQSRGVQALQQEVFWLRQEVEVLQRSRALLQEPLPGGELQRLSPWEFHEAIWRVALTAEARRAVPSAATAAEPLDHAAPPKPSVEATCRASPMEAPYRASPMEAPYRASPMEAPCRASPMEATCGASPMEAPPWTCPAQPQAQSHGGRAADAAPPASLAPLLPPGASHAQSLAQRAGSIAEQAAALKPSTKVNIPKLSLDQLQAQTYGEYRDDAHIAALLLARQASLSGACQAQPQARSSLGHADRLAAPKPATEVPPAAHQIPAAYQMHPFVQNRGDSVDGTSTLRPTMEVIPASACQPEPQGQSRGDVDDDTADPNPSTLTAALEESGFATGDEGEDSADPNDPEDSELSEDCQDSEGTSQTASQDSEPSADPAAAPRASQAEPPAGADDVAAAAAASGAPEWETLQGEAARQEEKHDIGPDSPRASQPAPAGGGGDQARKAGGAHSEAGDELSEGEPEDEPGDGWRAPAPSKLAPSRALHSSSADPVGGGFGTSSTSLAMQTEEAEEAEGEEDGREEPVQAQAQVRKEPDLVLEPRERAPTAFPGPSVRDLAAASAPKPATGAPTTPAMPLSAQPHKRWLCKFRVVLVCSDGSAGAVELMKLLSCHSEIAGASGLDFFEGVGSVLFKDHSPNEGIENIGAVLHEARARQLASTSDYGRKLWSWSEDQKGTKQNGRARMRTRQPQPGGPRQAADFHNRRILVLQKASAGWLPSALPLLRGGARTLRRRHSTRLRQQHEKRFIRHLADGMAPLEALASFTDRVLTEALTYGKNVALYETPCRSDAIAVLEQVYANAKMIHCVEQDEESLPSVQSFNRAEDGGDPGACSPNSVKEPHPADPRCCFEWGRSHPDRYLKVVCPDSKKSLEGDLIRVLTFLGVADQVDSMMRKYKRLGF